MFPSLSPAESTVPLCFLFYLPVPLPVHQCDSKWFYYCLGWRVGGGQRGFSALRQTSYFARWCEQNFTQGTACSGFRACLRQLEAAVGLWVFKAQVTMGGINGCSMSNNGLQITGTAAVPGNLLEMKILWAPTQISRIRNSWG